MHNHIRKTRPARLLFQRLATGLAKWRSFRSPVVLRTPPPGRGWDQWRVFDDWTLAPDLIVSLGGDCIAVSQVKARGLRPFSLPFDWCCASGGAYSMEKLAEQFESGFSGFARKENLEPFPGHRFGYRDKRTGFIFLHHFEADITSPGVFERFDAVLQRRLARLHKAIERSHSVLFLVSFVWKVDETFLRTIDSACSRVWPGKTFQYILLTYNSLPAEARHDAKFGVIRLPRNRTLYDLQEKSFEWSFLDGIQYSEAAKRMHKGLLAEKEGS